MGPKRPPKATKNLSKSCSISNFFLRRCWDASWTPKWVKNFPKNVEMLKNQWIFTSQCKFCLSAGPFFATPIEDSRSHLKKPMGFLRCERESSIGVANNGPTERQKIMQKKKQKPFQKLYLFLVHFCYSLRSRVVSSWLLMGIRLVVAWYLLGIRWVVTCTCLVHFVFVWYLLGIRWVVAW